MCPPSNVPVVASLTSACRPTTPLQSCPVASRGRPTRHRKRLAASGRDCVSIGRGSRTGGRCPSRGTTAHRCARSTPPRSRGTGGSRSASAVAAGPVGQGQRASSGRPAPADPFSARSCSSRPSAISNAISSPVGSDVPGAFSALFERSLGAETERTGGAIGAISTLHWGALVALHRRQLITVSAAIGVRS